MEIKNKLTVTRGEGERDNRKGAERRGKVKSRNTYKGLKDKGAEGRI